MLKLVYICGIAEESLTSQRPGDEEKWEESECRAHGDQADQWGGDLGENDSSRLFFILILTIDPCSAE